MSASRFQWIAPSIALVLCAHASARVVADCSWENPGANRFVGDRIKAVDSLSIPKEHRTIIKGKMKQREALGSDFPVPRVTFRKRSIVGDDGTSFNPKLTPMWFGRDTLCWQPSRERWEWNQAYGGDLFCSGGYCVAVPDVCGNVTQLFPGGDQFAWGDVDRGTVRSVPEPGTLLTVAAGIAAVALSRRRKR